MTLKVGDYAPDFTLLSDENTPISLKDFRGKKIVLFFYPKDFTPGCTVEVCDFRDACAHFNKLNTQIIGISKDHPKRHQQFKEKYALTYPLLSDETGDVLADYGVIDKKKLFGKTFLGIERSTFLIDENGLIRYIWRKVKVKNHTEKVRHELNQIEY